MNIVDRFKALPDRAKALMDKYPVVFYTTIAVGVVIGLLLALVF